MFFKSVLESNNIVNLGLVLTVTKGVYENNYEPYKDKPIIRFFNNNGDEVVLWVYEDEKTRDYDYNRISGVK